MRRFAPKSLLGQVTLVLALGLLVAQTVSVITLYRASEKRRDATIVNSIALRLVAETAGQSSPQARRLRREERRGRPRLSLEEQQRRLERMAEQARLLPPQVGSGPRLDELPPRGALPFSRLMRLTLQSSDESPVAPDADRVTRYERGLADLLAEQGMDTDEIRIVRRRAGEDDYIKSVLAGFQRVPFQNWRERKLLVAAVKETDKAGWLTVRLPEPKRESGGLPLIIAQTLVIFVVLMTLLYLVLRRITRPLAALTGRVVDFSRAPDRAVKLAETGPSDTRRLIAAHNTMEARIAALLDEKDVMLGAIGHDLKTPLAALRVRIESVPDEAQRAALVANIEDITCTLDDILSLARIGRASDGADAREAVDVTALADSVVEEFEDLGDPVTLELPEGRNARIVAQVQVTWLKRALRNLVSNAVRYGEVARVSVLAEGDAVVLRVDDDGSGIEEANIASMLEPFTRGESSRNRATGGTGLGLTLARAIADAHEGELVLANRREGAKVEGLRAEIQIPA